MPDAAHLLAAYDAELREEAEVSGAVNWDRSGPLWRAKLAGGTGFVSYRDLCGIDGTALDTLIAETIGHYAADPETWSFEWKTRGHDLPADLGSRLEAAGLLPEDEETVMVGEAAALADGPPLPDGVRVLRVDEMPDRADWVDRAAAMQRDVFGTGPNGAELLDRIERKPGLSRSGSPRPTARSCRPAASRRCRAPDSQGFGVAPPYRRGGVAASTAP